MPEEIKTLKSSSLSEKLKEIVTALEDNNYCVLQDLARSKGGLLCDELRRKIWPKLICRDTFATSPRPCSQVIEGHEYYQQVVMDVNRSLKRFPPSIKEKSRLQMQDQLIALIMRVLIKHPHLHYYQGYHDICVTFLLVLGEEISFNVVEYLSTNHLSPFMKDTMESTSDMLQHIYAVIGKESPKLRSFMEAAEVGVVFCLSWVITWFGHVLSNYADVVRLFDLFLASDPWLPLYVSAALVLYKEKSILMQDCDMASIHMHLTSLTNEDDLPFEDLIKHALFLIEKFPPDALKLELKVKPTNKIVPKHKPNNKMMTLLKGFFFSSWTIPLTVTVLVVAAAVIYQVHRQ